MYLPVINSKNDLYLYYEAIEQLKPQRVLDTALFLQRIGAVSRSVLKYGIDADLALDGYDCMKEGVLPVSRAIYTQIYTDAEQMAGRKFDLAMLLHVSPMQKSEQQTFEEILQNCTYILADEKTGKEFSCLRGLPQRTLTVDRDAYIIFGTKGV